MFISTQFHPLPPVARSYMTSEPKLFPLLAPSGALSLESPRRRRLNRTFTLLPAVSCSGSAGGDGDTFTENSGYLFELSQSDAESITEYDIVKIGSIYRRKPLILVRRLFQISTTLGKWFILRYIDGVKERADSMFKIRAAQLREILVELGPAYVKIAQAVSSRADLIPQSYLDELSILQDRIAPYSNEVAFKTIEQELGLEVDELFSEISLNPVAAASLGQVYRARLRSSGQMVAVKVQRPGVQAVISLDILILRFLVGLVRKAGKFNTDLQGVLDEWASSLFREMDYRKEAENGVKFRELYGSLQDVVVPQMYTQKTTRKILIMEWIEGKRLSEVNDLYLVEVGVYCSFNQLLEYGFYHADPHPGNLLRTYDGKLAYLDFGMMGEFKPELRDGFIEACLHLVNRDFDALSKDFVTLGLLPATADKDAVAKALTGVFQNAVSKGVQNISFGDLLGNLGTTMYKFKFRIPSYFSLVIRSLAVLEGIAISLNPEYKVLGSTYPWIARKVLIDSSPKLRSSLKDLLYKEGIFRIDRLESLLTESLRARTDKASLKKRGNELDSRLATKEILSFTLTEKGSFVREILIEEMAKDAARLVEEWYFDSFLHPHATIFGTRGISGYFTSRNGLDALGLATINSFALTSTSNLPILGSFLTMTEEDTMNLRNLRRLVLLVSGLENANSKMDAEALDLSEREGMYLGEIIQVLKQLASVQEAMPMLAVVMELPSEMQLQLFSLPGDLFARLLSRMAAKTIRRYFM